MFRYIISNIPSPPIIGYVPEKKKEQEALMSPSSLVSSFTFESFIICIKNHAPPGSIIMIPSIYPKRISLNKYTIVQYAPKATSIRTNNDHNIVPAVFNIFFNI